MEWLFNPYFLMASLLIAYLSFDQGEPPAEA